MIILQPTRAVLACYRGQLSRPTKKQVSETTFFRNIKTEHFFKFAKSFAAGKTCKESSNYD